MLVALCALVATILESRASRRHDRLSVKPDLNIHREFANDSATVSIQNGGLGPALIDQITLTFEKDEFSIEDALTVLSPKLNVHLQVTTLTRQYSILSGEKIAVLNATGSDKLALAEFLNLLRISLDYHSIYNEKTTVCGL